MAKRDNDPATGHQCANCGGQATHKHHIVPKSLGGTDNLSNLVSLCEICHGKVHSQNFTNHRALQKVGIEKAKKLGKYKGRKPTAMLKCTEVLHLYNKGSKIVDIVSELSVSRASVYRILDTYQPNWKIKTAKKISDPCDDWSKNIIVSDCFLGGFYVKT